MKNKEEGYKDQDPKPKPDPQEGDGKSRLDSLENDVGELKSNLTKVLTILETNKSDKTKSEDTDAGEKKPEDVKPEEDEVKNKEVGTPEVKPTVNPTGEGDDAKSPVKLPKAAAGETDGSGPAPAGNAGPELVQKNEDVVKKIVEEKMGELMKSMGITKTQTPRTNHEANINKENSEKKGEFAMEILKRAKAGTISLADMNRETKEFVQKNYEANLAKVMNAEVQ